MEGITVTGFALALGRRCFDKVERCFDIVAGVDGALRVKIVAQCRGVEFDCGLRAAESTSFNRGAEASRVKSIDTSLRTGRY